MAKYKPCKPPVSIHDHETKYEVQVCMYNSAKADWSEWFPYGTVKPVKTEKDAYRVAKDAANHHGDNFAFRVCVKTYTSVRSTLDS